MSVSEIETYLPFVSFVAGLGGSLHCVGMCGGLVTASCDRSQDVFRYQAGRLIGYLFLGLLGGLIGNFFNLTDLNPMFAFVPAVFIGGLFIFWGYQNFRGKRAELHMPRIWGKLYQKLWGRLVHKNRNFTKSFFTGLISILLPCGLLYGVVIGTVALQHTSDAMLSMFFFWLGTVPSMVIAPTVVQKLIRPLRARLPKTFAIGLMMIGILTISFRVEKILHINSHDPQIQKIHKTSCH